MHSDPTPHTPECRFGGAIRWSNGVTNWVTIVMEWLCVTCLHHTGAELNRNNRLLIAIVASDMTPSVNMTRPYVYKRHKDDERNRVLKHQTLCKQFKHITYDLSLFVHGSKGRGSHRHRNTMIPLGYIGASEQAISSRDHHGDVISDVKREVHNTGDVKCEVRVYP